MLSDLKKKTQEGIEALHGLFDDCQLVMLVDQETGLILSKSSESFMPQNKLEELAQAAQKQMRSALSQGIANTVKSPKMLMVTQIEKSGVVVTVQDLRSCEDALVCQFTAMPDRTDMMDMARDIFELSPSAEAA